VSDEPFSLEQLFSTVEQYLLDHLPGVQMVGFWPVLEGHAPAIHLPAVFLELAEAEPGADPGTGETVLTCKFEARIVVDAIKDDHHRQAVQLATQLAVLLRAQYWDIDNVGPTVFVQAIQDWTKPELDGYTVWLVEWTQDITLGEEEWPWPDDQPTHLDIVFGSNSVEVVAGVP